MATLTGHVVPGDTWYLLQVGSIALIGWCHNRRADTSSRAAKRAVVSPSRLALLCLFGLAAGVNIGSWVYSALLTADACPRRQSFFGRSVVDSGACVDAALALCTQAFVLTAGLYGAFAAASLYAPLAGSGSGRASAQLLASALAVGAWVLLGSQLCMRMGWSAGLATDVYVRLGVLVYAVSTYMDTRKLAERVRAEGDCDVVGHAVTIVGNILNLFIRVITVLAEMSASQQQREEEKKKASWKRRT